MCFYNRLGDNYKFINMKKIAIIIFLFAPIFLSAQKTIVSHGDTLWLFNYATHDSVELVNKVTGNSYYTDNTNMILYKLKSDSGRGNTNYSTGYDLKKVVDSLQININGKQVSGSYLTGNQPVTLSGDVTGSGTTAITAVLKNTGTSGIYGIVTTDAQGRITAGKRQETYSGATNGSGIYMVTFATAYSAAPNIQANLTANSSNQYLKITAISTTGFTINAFSFVTNTLLGIINFGENYCISFKVIVQLAVIFTMIGKSFESRT